MIVDDLPILEPRRAYNADLIRWLDDMHMCPDACIETHARMLLHDFLNAHGWGEVPRSIYHTKHPTPSWTVPSVLDSHCFLVQESLSHPPITVFETRERPLTAPWWLKKAPVQPDRLDDMLDIAGRYAAIGMKFWRIEHPYLRGLIVAKAVEPWYQQQHASFGTAIAPYRELRSSLNIHPRGTMIYRRLIPVEGEDDENWTPELYRLEFATEKDAILWNLHFSEFPHLRAQRL